MSWMKKVKLEPEDNERFYATLVEKELKVFVTQFFEDYVLTEDNV